MEREQMRMLLGRWGSTIKACADQQEIIDDWLNRTKNAQESALRAQEITCMPHGSGVGDPTGEAVITLEQIEACFAEAANKAKEDILERMRFKRAMDEAIEQLDIRQQDVIYRRYWNNQPIGEIANEKKYSQSSIEKIEIKAVDELIQITQESLRVFTGSIVL